MRCSSAIERHTFTIERHTFTDTLTDNLSEREDEVACPCHPKLVVNEVKPTQPCLPLLLQRGAVRVFDYAVWQPTVDTRGRLWFFDFKRDGQTLFLSRLNEELVFDWRTELPRTPYNISGPVFDDEDSVYVATRLTSSKHVVLRKFDRNAQLVWAAPILTPHEAGYFHFDVTDDGSRILMLVRQSNGDESWTAASVLGDAGQLIHQFDIVNPASTTGWFSYAHGGEVARVPDSREFLIEFVLGQPDPIGRFGSATRIARVHDRGIKWVHVLPPRGGSYITFTCDSGGFYANHHGRLYRFSFEGVREWVREFLFYSEDGPDKLGHLYTTGNGGSRKISPAGAVVWGAPRGLRIHLSQTQSRFVITGVSDDVRLYSQ
ncbi:MAG: hypothetical protein ACR2HJ_04545 [Fimbriimonadales bacterium]